MASFVFQADAPKPGLIPDTDAVGVTVVLMTCTYQCQEVIRVGDYVNSKYTETELRENPPVKPDFSKLQRNILASYPRVTRFHLNWEDNRKIRGCRQQSSKSTITTFNRRITFTIRGMVHFRNSLNVMLEPHTDCM
uniref:Uncharacterized protein n=1 Tax=Rhinolophus ferrumequinum TaxID=59479 RepID=A0A671FFR2_RHIFE